MAYIVRTNEEGVLLLPPDVLGRAEPHATYSVEVEDGTLILRPAESKPLWMIGTPQERAAAFRRWARTHPQREQPLPEQATHRDQMYD